MKKYIIPVLVLFSLAACNNDDDGYCEVGDCYYKCICIDEMDNVSERGLYDVNLSQAQDLCDEVLSAAGYVSCDLERVDN